jgi:hypothetical protein
MKVIVTPPPPPSSEVDLHIFYEHWSHRYWEQSGSIFVSLSETNVQRRLLKVGLSSSRKHGASEIDETLMRIQRENKVDYVGQIAGWPIGCYRYGNKKLLVTSETPLLTPTYGGSTVIQDFRKRLYGPEQAAVKHAWTKLSIEARREGERRIKAGLPPSWPIQQSVCIVGAKNHGKTIDGQIDLRAIGGPDAKAVNPTQSHNGDTSFNEDLSEEVLHLMDDEGGRDDYAARRRFGEEIKKSVATIGKRVHGKGKKALTLDPFTRTVILINDKLEDIRVLPPMDKGMKDKFILLKTIGSGVDRDDGQTFQSRMDHYVNAVSDYLGWLEEWKIPDELLDDPDNNLRYGIKSYANQDVLDTLSELSNEIQVKALLERFPELNGQIKTSGELFAALINDPSYRAELQSIAKSPIIFGKIVSSTAEKFPGFLVEEGRSNGSATRYRIVLPHKEQEVLPAV